MDRISDILILTANISIIFMYLGLAEMVKQANIFEQGELTIFEDEDDSLFDEERESDFIIIKAREESDVQSNHYKDPHSSIN